MTDTNLTLEPVVTARGLRKKFGRKEILHGLDFDIPAGRIYGHVGIYVGNGTVMDNVGFIRSIGVDEWIAYYGVTVTPRWGWIGDWVLG